MIKSNKETIALLAHFNSVREQLKNLKKEESKMSALIKKEMGTDNVLQAGEIIITRKEVKTNNFSQKVALEKMGQEFMDSCKVDSSYQTLGVTVTENPMPEIHLLTDSELNTIESEQAESNLIAYLEGK